MAVHAISGHRWLRRRLTAGAAMTAFLALVSACGSSAAPASGAAASTSGQTSQSAESAAGSAYAGPSTTGPASAHPGSAGVGVAGSAYPMTLKTAHGDVTITAAPTRVVALNVASADELISLGVTPVAAAVNPSSVATAYPWMASSLDGIAGADLSSASGELNVEAIAQTHPALIIAAT